MMEKLNPWMVATIILGAVLVAVAVRHVLIVRDQNLWRKHFGFVPSVNPHDPITCARLVAEKLEQARNQMYDAERGVDSLEKQLESARGLLADTRGRLAVMERLARGKGFNLVLQT